MRLLVTFTLCLTLLNGFSQSKNAATDTADWDRLLSPTEAIAQFPEGDSAWKKFVNDNLHYPKAAKKKAIQGIVILEFMVNRDGTVNDVEVISGPEELRKESLRIVKKSPKWTPAIQGGRYVNSYVKQSITFTIPANVQVPGEPDHQTKTN